MKSPRENKIEEKKEEGSGPHSAASQHLGEDEKDLAKKQMEQPVRQAETQAQWCPKSKEGENARTMAIYPPKLKKSHPAHSPPCPPGCARDPCASIAPREHTTVYGCQLACLLH